MGRTPGTRGEKGLMTEKDTIQGARSGRPSVLDKYRFEDVEARTTSHRVIKRSSPRKAKTQPSNKSVYEDLQPSLTPEMKIVFVGFNPGLQSSLQQHHYAHFTNLFWKLFNESKILANLIRSTSNLAKKLDNDEFLRGIITIEDNGEYKTVARPEHDYDLAQYGVGFTDLILRCTRSAAELNKQEKLENVKRLVAEFNYAKPRAIVIVGKGIWECIVEYIALELGTKYKLDKSFQWGRQQLDEAVHSEKYRSILEHWFELVPAEMHLYVFPNTSGLVASLKYDQKLAMWNDLSDDILGSA